MLDWGIFKDLRSMLSGAGKQGHDRIDRVELAIPGNEQARLYLVRVECRVKALSLSRPDQFRFNAETLGNGGAALKLDQAIAGAGKRQRPVLFEAHRLASFGLESGIKLHVVTRQCSQAVARAKLHDEAGGVPGGATGQRSALKHGYIGFTKPSQVIGNTGSGNAAADDNYPGMAGERIIHGVRVSKTCCEGVLSRRSFG